MVDEEVVPGFANEEIEELLVQFRSDTDAIKSYTGKFITYICDYNLKDANELMDDFRNLIRNNFLEDTDETFEFRDGVIAYILKLKDEISELKHYKDFYQCSQLDIQIYEKLFIEDFVVASNILNLTLDKLFENADDVLIIKCSSILIHKLHKYEDVMNKLKKMNYHSCFEKKSLEE